MELACFPALLYQASGSKCIQSPQKKKPRIRSSLGKRMRANIRLQSPNMQAGKHSRGATTKHPDGEKDYQKCRAEHHLPRIGGCVSNGQCKGHGSAQAWGEKITRIVLRFKTRIQKTTSFVPKSLTSVLRQPSGLFSCLDVLLSSAAPTLTPIQY